MRSLWNGSISFGLVNIPVKMFTATQNKNIKFRYLHKDCHNPIRYQRTCPKCDVEIKTDDIVRGYEYEKNRFVVIDDEEFEQIDSATTKALDILDFVSLTEIDPVYYDKSYYLSPSETGIKAYKLLVEALEKSGRIGIAKLTIRNKQSLAAVRVYNNVLMVETMYYPDEVKNATGLPNFDREITVDERELQMALQLVDSLTATFDPDKYHDTYREKLLNLIEAKIAGEEISLPAPKEQGNIVDLVQALKSSIEAVEKERKAPRRTGSDT